eukprot:jgi/Galph1/4925/GphlegSOOS_G3535.1
MHEEKEWKSTDLGKQIFWESSYAREYQTYVEHAVNGEDWFEQYTCHGKRISSLLERIAESCVLGGCNLLDVGCGNGTFLLKLNASKFARIVGIDYSFSGIQLAKQVAMTQQSSIEWLHADIFCLPETVKNNRWTIIHDKGTLDAIELQGETCVQAYLNIISTLVHYQGFFVITSCNKTLDELKLLLTKDFCFIENIHYPSFHFGGKEGSVLVTAVFKRNEPKDI